MNYVIILTDSQNKSMVGAYGNKFANTPNLDRLANGGTRFERAYTASPLCTPARSALFTGLGPQINGAISNNVAIGANIPTMGEIFSHYGFRTAYTGKWHLDGSAYFGDGIPAKGFEPQWWYDGVTYKAEIGPEKFSAFLHAKMPDDLREVGFSESDLWGHNVANRAIAFLEDVRNAEPFVLVCSFDEPHSPFVALPEDWEACDCSQHEAPPNFNAPVDGKPALARVHRASVPEMAWEDYVASPDYVHWHACNSYIDREIGRVIETAERLHGAETVIIYTTDHGDYSRAHGLKEKGPMIYQEVANVPFLVRFPRSHGDYNRTVSQAVVSHLDVIPTMLDLEGIAVPEKLHGCSMKAALAGEEGARKTAFISFHRFAINQDRAGEFYPVRCAVDDRFKLIVNLDDGDEFYDLANDPFELQNQIASPEFAVERDRLHDQLLDEMDRTRDLYRSWRWSARSWRSNPKSQFYETDVRRNRPAGFPFEPTSVEAKAPGDRAATGFRASRKPNSPKY